ncbi:MAG TPA: zinc dependent phospholipase C family protein [Dehalococcoidia bacterium]|nr:zinc dependent phospholipase C family protein [Dehalococcoidia bacterium]
MPPLGLHMTVARELAADLRSPRLDADRGAYYLGATTPDIRVLTRWDRERTHFFDLHCLDAQSGVHRLFEEQPQLRDAAALDAGTAAFVAGYISHLVLDERYITEIYRRYFGKGGVLGDEVMANVMDRLLQLHMDREQREDAEATAEIRDALAQSAVEVAVDFIGRDTLLQWRDRQIDVISAAPHFERMMSRHLQAAGIAGEEAIATFMEQHADELLRGTIHRIGEERIREYLSDAKAQARAAMREYLS